MRLRRTIAGFVLATITCAVGAQPAAGDGGGPATRVAPVNVAAPTITGAPRVGKTLAASQGQWVGAPTAFFYQWLRCDGGGAGCAPLAGETQPTFALSAADLGSRIRVEVVASNADGSSPAQRSAATRIVRAAVPTLSAPPSVTGSAIEGATLTADPGAWTGTPTSFTYAWQRCLTGTCTTVPGAVAQTYPLTAADVGTRVRVRVLAHNAGGHSRAARSMTTATVKPLGDLFSLGTPRRDQKRGLARFRITIPSAGTLTLARTAKVKGEQRRLAGPGTYKLTVKPRGQAKRKLRTRGKAKVRAFVTFAPDGGTAVTKKRRLILKQSG